MIGEPKFKREEPICFTIQVDGKEQVLDGVIYVVDAFGTMDQTDEPSYDIECFYEGETTLFKHIRESWISNRI